MQTVCIPVSGGQLSVNAWHWHDRQRETVMLIPSLGRGAADFSPIAGQLSEQGLRCIAIDPRGVGNSSDAVSNASLLDYARDVGSAVAAANATRVHVVGHAFGNRVARCFAKNWPSQVASVTLLAAGGYFDPEPEAREAMLKLLGSATLSNAQLDACLSCALFAPGSEPAVWRHGWHRRTAGAQIAAAKATPRDDWWSGGSAPMLIVQGLADRMALPANGRKLQSDRPDTRLEEIANAGHAMLPEAPDAIAGLIYAFVTRSGAAANRG